MSLLFFLSYALLKTRNLLIEEEGLLNFEKFLLGYLVKIVSQSTYL